MSLNKSIFFSFSTLILLANRKFTLEIYHLPPLKTSSRKYFFAPANSITFTKSNAQNSVNQTTTSIVCKIEFGEF